MQKYFVVPVCLALLFCMAYRASGNDDVIISVEKYSLENGLIQSMVTFADTDGKGLLWVGTGGGLHYFDGNTFHVFRHREGDPYSLPDNVVRKITVSRDGTRFVGTSRSIAVFNPVEGRFQTVCTPKLSEPVCLGPQNGETLFFWTRDHGLFGIKKGKPVSFTPIWQNGIVPPEGFYPCEVQITRNGTLLFSGYYGLLQMNPQKTGTGYPSKWTALDSEQHPTCRDRSGQLWLLNDGKTCLYNENGTLQPVYENGIRVPSVFLVDSKGNHWIADAETQVLYRFRNGNKQTVRLVCKQGTFADTLKAHIKFLNEDRAGNIWIGTDGQGLLLHTPDRFTFDLARIGFVRSIAATADDVWAGTYKNGLWRLLPRLDQKQKIINTDIPADADVLSLLTDERQRLWVVTEKGLTVLDKENHVRYRFPKNLPSAKLMASGNDTVALYSPGKMFLFEAGPQITALGSGTAPFIVTDAYDNRGFRWAGSRTHLYRIGKNRSLHTLSRADSLHAVPSKSVLPYAGKILTTADGGINIWDEAGNLSGKIPLPGQIIADKPYGLLRDGAGRIWMSSDRGLACLVPQSGKWYIFDVADNLQSLEFSSSAYCRSENGRLYYGGIEGMNGFDPACFMPQKKAPAPFLIRLTCSDTLYCQGVPGQNIALVTDGSHANISGSVSTSDYLRPEKRTFSFLLKGYDKTWSAPSERMDFAYEKLPPGAYTLMAKGIDPYGTVSDASVLLTVTVLPPFWQKGWFVLLASVCLVTGIVYIVKTYQKWRYRKIIRRWEQKDALNQERLRIARDLHDDIGAELSRIAILARNKTSGNENLDRISEKTLTLIENLRHIIWSTDPRNDKADDLQAILREYMSGFAEKNGWTYSMTENGNCPALSLSAIAKRNIFLILKECLNNTWKHARADSVELHWTCLGSRLQITYADNGQGITTTRNSKGYGLANMHERAGELNGNLSVGNRPQGGLQIILTLPV